MSTTERGLLIGAIALLLLSLAMDLRLTTKYGGVDLRDKVVGARSLMEGRSIYFQPWQPGEPERFADPMVPPGAKMTRYTGTPFQALLLSPLGLLPFQWARLAWLFAQYALLIAALAMAWRAFGTQGPRDRLLLGLLLFAFLASTSWHLHVERGQVYVIFAAVIAGLFAALVQKRLLTAGMLAAALVLFKPTYAVLLLPLVLHVRKRLLAGALAFVAIVAIIFAMLPGGLAAWVEYHEAMVIWSTLVGQGEPPSADPDAFVYPAVIEGMANLRDHHPMEFENGSITTILVEHGLTLPVWLPGAMILAFLGALALWLGRLVRRATAVEALLLGFCCWTVLMMVLPVPRFDYQIVHWVGPLACLLLGPWPRPPLWYAALLLAAVLVVGAWSLLPVGILMAELLLLALILWSLRERWRGAVAEG